jgi:hypothetical protein
MDDLSELFDDDGFLSQPTMRGSANLDIQDYQGIDGRSSILDDELFEDTPSTPGRNPGAAPAPDIDGLDRYGFLPEMPDDDPSVVATTYGAHPWGPGAKGGYRPFSQQRTGMDLNALGDEAEPQQPAMPHYDEMMQEPEVIDAVAMAEALPWGDAWKGNQNPQPSNAEVDPMTLYDRSSYERTGSSQNVIGNGIFEMEEGVTWNARDGEFMNQYALPAYLSHDDMAIEQSAMWDSTAAEWRVTQPSASGVTLATRVPNLKKPPKGLRPEITGPRSHIEAFGRKAARCVMNECKRHGHTQDRSRFLVSVAEALGPGRSAQAKKVADALVEMGYRKDVALEDAMAHLFMHAVKDDLLQKTKSNASALPRLDRAAKMIAGQKPAMQAAAREHIAPLTQDRNKLRDDLGRLYASPSARGMGMVGDAPPEPAAPTERAPLITPKRLMWGGILGLGAYVVFTNRKAIAKNIKKVF